MLIFRDFPYIVASIEIILFEDHLTAGSHQYLDSSHIRYTKLSLLNNQLSSLNELVYSQLQTSFNIKIHPPKNKIFPQQVPTKLHL